FSEDGATSALSIAMFPSGVAADSNGHLYIADVLNNQVFLVYLPWTFKPSRETAGRDFRAIGDWRRWRPWGSRCRRRLMRRGIYTSWIRTTTGSAKFLVLRFKPIHGGYSLCGSGADIRRTLSTKYPGAPRRWDRRLDTDGHDRWSVASGERRVDNIAVVPIPNSASFAL